MHGCTIEDHCLIGINAVLMDGAVIGRGSIVAGGAVVPEGKKFAPGSIIAGVPAKVIAHARQRAREPPERLALPPQRAFTRRGDYRAWDGPEFEAWRRAKREEIAADRDL